MSGSEGRLPGEQLVAQGVADLLAQRRSPAAMVVALRGSGSLRSGWRFPRSPSIIPELPEWRDRSRFVRREGRLDVFHLDFYSQALSKLERSFDQDLEDVRAMVDRGLVDPVVAIGLFEQIESELFRYPAIDPPSFRARVERAFPSPPGGRGFEPG